jgi:D-alanyl-D-alanine carboxypeptidase (penicillin-binding protein 5/6)
MLLVLSLSGVQAYSPEDELTARAAILVDAASGKVLYEREPDLRLPPASTTKVITAIVALESGRQLTELLTVSKAATRVPASKLYLRPGQKLSVQDLLYGIMLSSANDASNVLAEGIGGSVERFAEMMTKKAHLLGATNTQFTNPHGLTDLGHYSTARDLVTIFQYAMKNPTFRRIVQTKISAVSSSSIVRNKVVPRRISVRNHNRLLWNFEGALGGKTGYTLAAQKCFVGAVQRNGATLLISVLGSRNLWGDTRQLLEYGFDHYELLKASTGNGNSARSAAAQSAGTVVFTAPEVDTGSVVRDGYVVQLGAFREAQRAESLARQIAARGLNPFLERITAGGEITYRVRMGPYAEKTEAEDVARDIFEGSGYQPIVVPVNTGFERGGRSS